ncbi:taste receptor type 2 member 40-like [Bombina bombina]|uniref:taste receptor type 2 member 40-like n=1 Tax=Bombina bombina TaxID=8345 RepID=UPI00235B0B49|nr:taste receptor type 2 member 40-like [Bombina bombina]
MYFSLSSLLNLIIGLLALTGLFFNGFVVTRNCIWWLQTKKLQTIDIIITSLGLSRFCLIVINIYNIWSHVFWTIANTSLVISASFTVFISYCSIWFSTLLCVFYCVKITNYNYRLFIYVKQNISRILPWLYLVSVTASLICSLPDSMLFSSLYTVNSTIAFSNSSVDNVNMDINPFGWFKMALVGSFIPLLMFCFAISLLIASLWNHTRHMNRTDSGFRNPQLDAHFSAIKNMLLFLVLYIIYFIPAYMWHFVNPAQNMIWISFFRIVFMVYPSLHTVILIFSNIKLKQALMSIMHCL